jgi:hypothetical protein
MVAPFDPVRNCRDGRTIRAQCRLGSATAANPAG